MRWPTLARRRGGSAGRVCTGATAAMGSAAPVPAAGVTAAAAAADATAAAPVLAVPVPAAAAGASPAAAAAGPRIDPGDDGGGGLLAWAADLGVLELPPELLISIMVNLLSSCGGAMRQGEPFKATVHNEAVFYPCEPKSADVWEYTDVSREVWARHSWVAGVCRAFRSAFLSAIVLLDVHLGADGADLDQDPVAQAAVVARARAVRYVLGHLPCLQDLTILVPPLPPALTVEVLEILFGGHCPGAIPHTVLNLGLWVDELPVTALRGLLRYFPSRLSSIFLSVDDWTGSRGEAAALVRSLHECAAPRLRAIELEALLRSLDLLSSVRCTQFFKDLPVFPRVRLVDIGCCALTTTEALLSAIAARCPAVDALVVGMLDAALNSAAGAATLRLLFPSLRHVSTCHKMDMVCDCAVSLAFVAALCRDRPLDTLCLSRVDGGSSASGATFSLASSLMEGGRAPSALRLDELRLTPTRVLSAVAGGLPGLVCLHLSALDHLSVAACRALRACATVEELFIGGGMGGPEPLLGVGLEHTMELGLPALKRLYLYKVELFGGAAAGLVTTLARNTPQTLEALKLRECRGEVESAILAVVHLHTMEELIISRHCSRHLVPHAMPPDNGVGAPAEEGLSRRGAPMAAAYLARHRPDVCYEGHFV